MSDILIVHQFEDIIINVFGMHFDFIILHVSTSMEVPLLGLQIGPCLKYMHLNANLLFGMFETHNASLERCNSFSAS